jgi:hypothetical protein
VGFGVAQGLMMLTHRWFRKICKARPKWRAFMETGWMTVARILFTYWTFILSLVIFRGADHSKIGGLYHALFIPQRGIMVRDPVGPQSLIFAFILIATCHVAVETGLWKRMSARFTPPVWGMVYVLIIVSISMLMIQAANKFIYFQF